MEFSSQTSDAAEKPLSLEVLDISRQQRKAEIKREKLLAKTADHIARHALKGETGFDANYSILSWKQPKTAADWRFVQERLADDGIMAEFVDVEDLGMNGDFSRRTVDVKSLPDDYEPRR